MADSTFRFRAESRVTYSKAVIALVRRAREGDLAYVFGPLNLVALEEQGLVVSGPGVREWVDDFLSEVPGLHLADE